MSKPRCIKSQKIHEVTCVYNSYCNFYETAEVSQSMWTDQFKEYWQSLPSTIALTQAQKVNRLKAMIGPGGYTPDVLKMQLRRINQHFLEKHNVPMNDFPSFVKNIDNGFISITVVKPFRFAHMVCVKDGYLIDSIGSQVYPWRGDIKGYKEWSFSSAIDCDQETIHQAELNPGQVIIDLIDD